MIQPENVDTSTVSPAAAGALRILLMGSLPLAAPWNGADKNLARFFATADTLNQFIVQTDRAEAWPPHVVPVRERSVSAMPTAQQKLRAFAYLLRYSGQADLVHFVASLQNPARAAGALMRFWHQLTGKPIIHTVPSIGDRVVRRDDFFADVTVAVSRYTQQLLLNAGIANVVRIYPPIDEAHIRPHTDVNALAREHDLGARAVLYPAHYGPTSGIAEMIDAFAALPAAYHDAVLAFACRTHPGQDAAFEAERVRQWAAAAGIADRVRVLATVSDMPALIQACALVALVPGKLVAKMDLPLVILEALLLERPVIIADQAPMNEALFGQAGQAVPYGDRAALTSALAALLADADRRRQLGAAGRRSVLDQCSAARTINQYQAAYQQAVECHKKKSASR